MCPRRYNAPGPFDITVPDLPARSRLFALPPLGLGTDHMEGLASYLTRLARAHAVRPRSLLWREFNKDGRLQQIIVQGNYMNALDGLGRCAKAISATAIELTTVPEVRHLSMLPMSDVLPERCPSLMSRELRWCPRCFAAMIKEGREPYRPLVWSIALYTVCHLHKKPLVAACGCCGKKQDFLPRYPDVTHCGRCGSSLAEEERHSSARPAQLDLWIASAIGDLIAHFPVLDGIALRARLVQFLTTVIDELADGSRIRFCSKLQAWPTAVDKILYQNGGVRLLRLLALAYGMGITPSMMFLPGGRRPQALVPLPARLRRERAVIPLTEQRRKQVCEELAGIVTNRRDTRSALEVSCSLGITPHRMSYWFPAEYTVICARHALACTFATMDREAASREAIEEAVRKIASRGEHPSFRKVAREIGHLHISLIQPDLRRTYRRAVRESILAKRC